MISKVVNEDKNEIIQKTESIDDINNLMKT
jgi:hypothetical protein